jgi:ribonuclease P protein component
MTPIISTLKKRSQFLKVSKNGTRFYGQHLIVQTLPNDELSGIVRVGYVATRKVGNAVKRNKAKRRLRALVSLYRDHFVKHHDYVLVARHSLWSVKFELLQNDFYNVIQTVNSRRGNANTTDAKG